MELNQKQARALNRFVKKLAFQEVKKDDVEGQFRITGIRQRKPDSHEYHEFEVEFEFKGKIRGYYGGSRWYSLSDYKWTSTVRRNRSIRYKLENDIRQFMRIFCLTNNDYDIKLGKLTWIE